MNNINNSTSEFWCQETAMQLDPVELINIQSPFICDPLKDFFPEENLVRSSNNLQSILSIWNSDSNIEKIPDVVETNKNFDDNSLLVKRPRENDQEFVKIRKLTSELPSDMIRSILSFLPLNTSECDSLLLLNKEWRGEVLACDLFRAIISTYNSDSPVYNCTDFWRPLTLRQIEKIKRFQLGQNEGIENFLLKNSHMNEQVFQQLYFYTYSFFSECFTEIWMETNQIRSKFENSSNIKWLNEQTSDLEKIIEILKKKEQSNDDVFNNSGLIIKLSSNCIIPKDSKYTDIHGYFKNVKWIKERQLYSLEYKSHAIISCFKGFCPFSKTDEKGVEFRQNWGNDREVAIAGVTNAGKAVLHISEELQRDREIAFFTVLKSGGSLKNLKEYFNNDTEIVLTAIENEPSAIVFAHERFKKDKKIALNIAGRYSEALRFLDNSFKKDKEVVLKFVFNHGYLEKVDKSLKKDPEVVLTAIKYHPKEILHADESLKSNEEFIADASRINPLIVDILNNPPQTENHHQFGEIHQIIQIDQFLNH